MPKNTLQRLIKSIVKETNSDSESFYNGLD